MKPNALPVSFIALLALFLILPVVLVPSSSLAQSQERRGLVHSQQVDKWPGNSRRWALVIGVDEYQDPGITKLVGASNDAKAIADALIRYAGFPKDQVILLTTDQPVTRKPTRGNILRRLSNLRGIVPKDGLLLVSFAGHGIERGGRAYLLPLDAQLGSDRDIALVEDTAINVETMRDRIRQTEVGQVVFILDACRNDPTAGRGESPNPLTAAYTRAFNFNERNREVTAFATLYATAVGQIAYEYKEKQQGYFTWSLVEGLKGEAADERGEVTLGSLIKYVQERVPKQIRIDLGASRNQKPFAVVEGYKADELVIAVAERASSVAAPRQEYAEVQTYTETVNRVEIEMVRVPAGKFLMGSPYNEAGRQSDEGPQHQVTVSSFYLGKYEVTQLQWRAMSVLSKVKIDLPSNPSNFKDDNLPVEQVSWEEAIEFCERLSRATGKTYRLPTEAEWEYSCRAMTIGPYAGKLDDMAWYRNNSDNKTHPVGTKQPNGFGLYDMHGNVWEWCMDWYGENSYFQNPRVDPTGPSTGSYRVRRGGGWLINARGCRSAVRTGNAPGARYSGNGFRLVRTLR